MQFVWVKGVEGYNKEVAFTCNLDGITDTENVELRFVICDFYNLYINGEFVSYGPARAAKGFLREEIIDITKFLNTGNNFIVFDVVYYNVNSLSHVLQEATFAAEIIKNGKTIKTTDSFAAHILDDRVSNVQRISGQRTFAEIYNADGRRDVFLRGDQSVFERRETFGLYRNRVIERKVSRPDFHKIFAAFYQKGYVYRDETKPVWETKLISNIGETLLGYHREEIDLMLSDILSQLVYSDVKKGDVFAYYQMFDFGKDITGKIVFEIESQEDADVFLVYDDILVDGELQFNRMQCLQACAWKVKKGSHNLFTFEPYTFRYVNFISTSKNCTINEVSCITIENPDVNKFHFESDNALLNEVVAAAKNTFAQNAVDVLTDCPSRERAGWLCDSYFSARAEKLLTGENKVEKSFLENFLLAPPLKNIPEDMFPMCYPAEHYDGIYIANWALWLIIELYSYAKRTNDKKFVNRFRKKVEKLIRSFDKNLNEYGLLENLENWVFVEWSAANEYVDGVNFPSNMLFCCALECAGGLFNNRNYLRRAVKMRKSIYKLSFNGEFFVDNAIRQNDKLVATQNISETCQYYAMFFEFIDRDKNPIFYEKIINKFGPDRDAAKIYPNVCKSNAFIGNFLRFDIMRREGYFQKILVDGLHAFGYMARLTQTLWELVTPTASCNHGFASLVANVIVEACTGYKDYDAEKKIIYMRNIDYTQDCKIQIPLKGGELVLTVNNHKLAIQKPVFYKIKFIKGRKVHGKDL